MIPDPPLRSRIDLIPNEGGGQETGQDALKLNIQTAGMTEEITLLGGKGNSFDPKKSVWEAWISTFSTALPLELPSRFDSTILLQKISRNRKQLFFF